MARRTFARMFVMVCFMAIGLLYFQNCTELKDTKFAPEDPNVRIIDDYRKGIIFAQSAVQVRNEVQSHDVYGFCERKSVESFHWVLSDEGRELESGLAACQRGGFRVVLSDIEKLECFKPYTIVAEDAAGAKTELIFSRRCLPESSSAIDVAGDSQCFMELHEIQVAGKAESRCSQVCYKADEVNFERVTDLKACSRF